MQDEVNSIIAEPNKKKGQKGLIIAIVTVLVLVAGVGVGIFLVQQNQEIRNQASTAGTCAYTVTGDCLTTEVWCEKDLRCYPADKASQVNCANTETPENIDKRVDTACNNGNNVTICGKTQTWSQFDKELQGASYPGPFNHARTEARAYIGAACPETLAQAAAQSSPTATPDYTSDVNNCGVSGNTCNAGQSCVNGICTNAESTTPTPTTTNSLSGSQTTAPTSTPTPTATSSTQTSTPTPTSTSRVSTVQTDQGIPQTGTGTPVIIGTGVGILLLMGAVILAL